MTGSGLVRRLLSVAALLGVLLAAVAAPLAGPASAAPDYPPKFNKITASTFVVARHGTVKFTARYYQPGSTVRYQVVVKGDVVAHGRAVADAKGVAYRAIRFDVAGKNRVTFTGTAYRGGTLPLSARITVTSSEQQGGGTGAADTDATASSGSSGGLAAVLPHTGAQVAGALLGAAALIGGGFLLVAVGRKRRHS